jgi:hypothetical protein
LIFARAHFLFQLRKKKFCFGVLRYRAGGGFLPMSRSNGAAGGVQGEECRAVLAWFWAGAAKMA